MSITLKKLCHNTERTYDMVLCAGENGLNNIVRWVHMVEDAEVPDFLHGNELVFTTGIGHFDTSWLLDFVRSLKEHNAAGLVVNIGPHITSIPTNVIIYCEQNSLPLFTLPWKVHIIDITYDFCRRIIANENMENSLGEAFKNLIFNPQNKEGYVSTLERAGFYEKYNYTLFAISLITGDKSINEIYSSPQISLIINILRKSKFPSCLFIQDKNIVCVRTNQNRNEINELLQIINAKINEMSLSGKLFIGVSNTLNEYTSVPICYNNAVSALRVAHINKASCLEFKDIGIYKLLFGVNDISLLMKYHDDILGKIIEYDKLHKTDLLDTLKTYIENDCSVQKVAEKYSLHRNTINYKIKTIKQIQQYNLDAKTKAEIAMAFYVHEILNK